MLESEGLVDFLTIILLFLVPIESTPITIYQNRIFEDEENNYIGLSENVVGSALILGAKSTRKYVLFDAATYLERFYSVYLVNMDPKKLFDVMRMECEKRCRQICKDLP